MKKRFISILTIPAILFCILPQSVSAEATDNSTIVIPTEDGGYLTITTTIYESRATNSKSGTRSAAYTSADGLVCWTFVLGGTFSYNGSTATCTNTYDKVNIYDEDFHEISSSSWANGNKACGSAEIVLKVLGITVNTWTPSLTLTCSPTGTIT